ncbi:hypothetical protein, partial [Staphylococcus aureus]|uniref:hypothetical protein n=1 Tax=Staphylococcus aureus TaxID=1280 RepID=UPI001EE1DFD7
HCRENDKKQIHFDRKPENFIYKQFRVHFYRFPVFRYTEKERASTVTPNPVRVRDDVNDI